MAGIEKDYYNILEGLKEKIRLARQKAALAVNRELLQVYWEIGNAILQQQKEEGWAIIYLFTPSKKGNLCS